MLRRYVNLDEKLSLFNMYFKYECRWQKKVVVVPVIFVTQITDIFISLYSCQRSLEIFGFINEFYIDPFA